MNTHDIDIELPPLPNFDRLSSMHADDVVRLLSSYGRKCARAAIEADRKRTAELLKNPVHVHSNMCRGIIAPITFDMLAHVLGEEATKEWLRNRRGAPVKVSDEADALTVAYLSGYHKGKELVKLECPKCGADRAKEPCAGNLMNCAFKGEAHAADPVNAGWCEGCTPDDCCGCGPHTPAEPVLDAPAKVGGTRFGKGIKWSTVIAAAQRRYAYEVTPTKEQERIKRATEFVQSLQSEGEQPAEPVKVPSEAQEIRRLYRAIYKVMERLGEMLDKEQYGVIDRLLTDEGVEPPSTPEPPTSD